jgi:hypothetical protein
VRASGHDTGDYDRLIAEGTRALALVVLPKSDPECALAPPSIGLTEARLMATRLALRLSELEAASRYLGDISDDFYPCFGPWLEPSPELEREMRRLWQRHREAQARERRALGRERL